MFGYSINPCISNDDRNAALDRCESQLRKKRQRDPNLPHFLAIAPTFPRIAVSTNEFANTWDILGLLIK